MGYPMANGYRASGGERSDAPSPDMGFQDGWQGLMDIPWVPPPPGVSVPQIPAPVSLGLSLLIRRNPWVRAALVARDLMRISSNIPPDGQTPQPCANGVGVGTYHGGGSCISVNHFTSTHQPPRFISADENGILFEDTHDCVPAGFLFGQPLSVKTKSYPYASGWVRTSGLPKPRLFPFGFTFPLSTPGDPQWNPSVDPFYMPINQPRPDFEPLPWFTRPYVAPPWSDPSPSESPRPRPRVPALPAPGEPPALPGPGTRPDGLPGQPGPGPDTSPNPKPGDDPGTSPKPKPDPKPQVGTATPIPKPKPEPVAGAVLEIRPPSSHRQQSPPKGVREIKVKAHMLAKLAYRFTGHVTEIRDMLKSLHDALPKRLRTKRKCHGHGKFRQCNAPSVQKMFMELYHATSDGVMTEQESKDFINKGVDNLITDQIKDFIFGKIGQQIAKASKADGRPIGYQAGPSL